MRSKLLTDHFNQAIATLHAEGLFKDERVITTAQQAVIDTAENPHVINFCANNYLGLANHPTLIKAAQQALDKYGFGMSSVRFICGTQTPHKALEKALSEFLGMEDTILYSSCFDANTGLFETLLTADDAIISDSLNHASIIDGVRLCKAKRFLYKNNNLKDLSEKLKEADDAGARFKLIATDGVFSMDGIIANLQGICDLAEEHQALVMVDDSHAVGFIGKKGRGSHELCDVMGRVDILTGTLGKALGGASGGYTASSKTIVSWLRQRSRPYLFSNTLAPMIASASLAALELLASSDDLRAKLHENGRYFRDGMTRLGFKLIPGEHPIVPVMLGDAKLAKAMSEALLKKEVYVIAFSYPVVPQGLARIRVQMSAAHEREHLDKALTAFEEVGRELGAIPS